MRKPWPALATLLYLLLAAASGLAQTAHFLALEGEGTASVLVDRATATAYLTDGGKGGRAGIAGAFIEGKPVLDYLIAQDVTSLVITCSHPHADHMGGLKSLVRDPKLLTFAEITFVDDIDQTNIKSLHTLYKESLAARGPAGPEGRPKVSYSSAKNRNAFAGLERPGATVRASNFVYDAERIGTGAAHDRSIISQYEIREGGKTTRVVDLDDASSELIAAWSGRTPRPRFEVLVASHHGSAHNDLGPILQRRAEFGLRDVIVTVNVGNRYDHPSPDVLQRLLRELGPDHVFITGSTPGDNVEIGGAGVRSPGGRARHRERLRSFVQAQLDMHQARIRTLGETAQARAGGKVRLTAGLAGQPSEALLDSFGSHGLLTPRQLSAMRRSLAATKALEAALVTVGGKASTADRSTALVVKALAPMTLPEAVLGASEPPTTGQSRYKETLDEYRDLFGPTAEGRGGDPTGPSSPGGGGGGGGGLGSGGDSRRAGESSSGTRGSGVGGPSGGGGRGSGSIGGGGRGGGGGGGRSAPRPSATFGRMRALRVPVFGGVILGNTGTYDGPAPSSLQFLDVAADPDDPPALVVRVGFADGTVADFADLTATELWAGYHFVTGMTVGEPGERWAVPGNAAGLVGIHENHDSWWDFQVHPAIAGTPLARDAMRLDMLISALREAEQRPAALSGIAWSDLDYTTYQWYDAPATVRVENGRLAVAPAGEPRSCLMRVRLVRPVNPPGWYGDGDESGHRDELERRLLARFADADESSTTREQVTAAAEEIAGEMRKEIEESYRDDESLNPRLGPVCAGFDALQSIDRLARVVALLNWFHVESNRPLPPLPSAVIPVRLAVPASWSMAAVLAGEATGDEAQLEGAPIPPEPEPTPTTTPAPTAAVTPAGKTGCAGVLVAIGGLAASVGVGVRMAGARARD